MDLVRKESFFLQLSFPPERNYHLIQSSLCPPNLSDYVSDTTTILHD